MQRDGEMNAQIERF